MQLAERNRGPVVDLLSERLAFERSTVRLYDRILETLRGSTEAAARDLHATMLKHRGEEEEAARWLEGRIRELAGDGGAETDLGRLATREARGIEEVADADGADATHLFHALLAVEGVDVAGWELLVELAEGAGDARARHDLERHLRRERQHLAFVRRAIERLAVEKLFGEGYAEEHAMELAANLPP
jgi:ferritin-like metal-binding protein YciE